MHVLAAQLIGQLSRSFYSDSIRDRTYILQLDNLLLFQRLLHARRMLGLYADNTAAGTHCLDCNGNAADQTAPANRYDYRIHITELIQNFQTDRTLSGNDIFIIKGLHEYCACDFLQILRDM